MFKKTLLILLAATLFGGTAVADQLIMKNGSVLIGKLISAEEGHVVFETPFSGETEIKAENIERFRTHSPVTLMLADGSIYKNKLVDATEEGTVARAEGEPPILFQPEEIKYVNPHPWKLGEGYKWFGDVNISVKQERGNTDTGETDSDFNSIWRSLEDRYTLFGLYEYDEANGDKNKNTWSTRGKYDRFRQESADDYYGMQVAFKYDEAADLDLRTTFGPYIGRQFYSSKVLTLAGELGLVYVDEQFEVKEDNDFWGGSWEVEMTSDFIPHVDFYINQNGILNSEDIDGVIVNTTVGLSVPVIYGIKTSLEARYEYDGGAADDIDTLDSTYRFKLGYSW
jgi:hypothetical protein